MAGCTADGKLRRPTAAELDAARLAACLARPDWCPRPRPTPEPVPACCIAQAGTFSIDPPGRVCAENDRGCWHDPADGCDSCWVFIPLPGAPTPTPAVATATPAPTPTLPPGRACKSAGDCFCWTADGAYQWCPTPEAATPTPTATVPTPTPTPAPTPATSCLVRGEVPEAAVPIFTGQPCRRGFVSIFAPRWAQDTHERLFGEDEGCIRQWKCAEVNDRCDPGDDCRSPIRRIQSSLNFGGPGGVHRCFPDEAPGPQFICDGDRPGQEAYGRNIRGDRSVIVPDEVDHDEPWARASICRATWCEDPTPAPPTPGPIPTPPAPRGSACLCEVGCSVMHLGWNDRPGVPPWIVAGGHATADVTCRQAQSEGDTRGQPVDRSNGPEWCEPASDPVEFEISSPVPYRIGNDGYRVDFNDLKAGHYSISVKPRPGAVYRNGEPVAVCSWGHNDSVKTLLEFDVQ